MVIEASEDLSHFTTQDWASYSAEEHDVWSDGANALAQECDRRPFDLDAVLNQPFEIDHLQDVLFVIDSFDELFEAVAELAARS